MDRRFFLSAGGVLLAAGSSAALADGNRNNTSQQGSAPTPAPTSTPARSRVIVIGGGMAGATVAKYLRLWGNNIAVTLVERNSTYASNIFSSMVLTGQRTMSTLTFNYNKLLSAYGVQVV